jgi:hypothetical protein
MANSRLAKVVSVEFSARERVCAVVCKTSQQDGGRPSTGIPEILYTETSIAEI